jgi:hypothetical protein
MIAAPGETFEPRDVLQRIIAEKRDRLLRAQLALDGHLKEAERLLGAAHAGMRRRGFATRDEGGSRDYPGQQRLGSVLTSVPLPSPRKRGLAPDQHASPSRRPTEPPASAAT